jgi:hypothetical protein
LLLSGCCCCCCLAAAAAAAGAAAAAAAVWFSRVGLQTAFPNADCLRQTSETACKPVETARCSMLGRARRPGPTCAMAGMCCCA